MGLGDALAWLDGHQNLERMLALNIAPPDATRMQTLVDVLGHPERSAPVVHVTGTNGKTSVSRAVTALLMAKGLRVGTYTSPHLERINERICVDNVPIGDDDLAGVLSEVALVEPTVLERLAAGRQRDDHPRLTWFELLTAAGLVWFADAPVDVLVLEVGIGGRWDATNVADATVAVVSNIGLDHTAFLGPTRADVAAEKAGIVKPGSTLVLGERDPDLYDLFAREEPATLWLAGRDFELLRNDLAVGGRVLDVLTPAARYDGLWLDLHGRHQADNFLLALVAAEAFFAAPLEERLVRSAAGNLSSPGRLEVVHRRPLVVLDGAKNPDGARTAAATVASDFGGSAAGVRTILVAGMLAGHSPEEMLAALGAAGADLVVACSPPTPRAEPASAVAAAARAAGAKEVVIADSVADAVKVAMDQARPEDVILVAGSLYVVGAARGLFSPPL